MIHVRSRSRGWPAAGAAWTPADLTNIHGWWKPESLGADLSLVANWPDQSGNGRDYLQATQTNQPQVHTNLLDGFGGVRGDAVDNFLSLAVSADVAANAAFSFVFIASWDGTPTDPKTFSFDSDNFVDPFGGVIRQRIASVVKTLTVASSVTLDGTFYLVEIYRTAAGVFQCFINGVDKTAAGPPSTTAATKFKYLMSLSGTSQFNDTSYIEHLFSLNTKWSTDEQASLRAYMDSRYPSLGVTVP